MNDSNDGSIMFLGGAIAVIAIGALCLKFLRSLFLELTRTFDAFGKMATSFAGTLWGVAQVAFFAALIVGAIVAAIYFTYKYIQMVRRATDVQNTIRESIDHYQYKMQEAMREFRVSTDRRIQLMEYELRKALSARAESALPQIEGAASAANKETTAEGEPNAHAEISTTQKQGDPNERINTVSNPY